ncbi:MAG: SpoIIE family protein phosphatase [Bernardetiaceae bacterium]|nr:SpoIIE family protein phosphatase [Bernardetiaceae bacterium]
MATIVSTRKMALSIIISLVIGFFTLVLGLLFSIHHVEQKNELNRISNIVARQRALVKALQAAWLQRRYSQVAAERMQARHIIDSLTVLLENTHFNLLNKSDTLAKAQLYHTAEIDQHLSEITPNLVKFTDMIALDTANDQKIAALSDQLASQFGELADVHYARLHLAYNRDTINYLWGVLIIVSAVVIFQNLFLLYPTFKKLDEKIKEAKIATDHIEKQNRQLLMLQDSLTEQNDELKTKQEELIVLTEELKRQNQLLEEKQKLIAEAYQNIRESIRYANRIQTALRTDPQSLIESFPDCFILEKSKDILSGDFYWFTQQDNYNILAVADCTGHGVPAALMTMIGITALHQIVNIEKILNPSTILHKLNERLREIFRPKKDGIYVINDGMEISLLVFDMQNYQLVFAAANGDVCLVRNGSIQRLRSARVPIGGFQIRGERDYPEVTIQLQVGDKIYVYTDGFQDQFGGPENTKYHSRRFRELLLQTSNMPMQKQRSMIVNELRDWQGMHPQTDDILIIGIQPC